MTTSRNTLNKIAKLGLKNVGKTKLEDFAGNGENWVNGFINLAKTMKQQVMNDFALALFFCVPADDLLCSMV